MTHLPIKIVVVASASALVLSLAQAQLDPEEKLLEVMKDVQGHQSLVIGREFGTDPNTTLHFSMTGDSNSNQFSFSCHGQSYKGQNIDIDCNGTGDAAGDNWTWSSVGSLGSEHWQLNGASNYDFAAATPLTSNSLANRGAGKPKPDEHSGTVWTGPFSTTWTIHTRDGVEVGNSVTFDFRFKVGNSWGWNHRMDTNLIEGKPIGTFAEGNWNTDQGRGEFSMQVVPEPTSCAGIVIGLLALIRRRKLSRQV